MDISRLLSCSITNKNETFRESNLENRNLIDQMGGTLGSGTQDQNSQILDQPKEKAYDIAQKQLKVAVNLQNEIDDLRLKLSDRWTDHLASNCQIQ